MCRAGVSKGFPEELRGKSEDWAGDSLGAPHLQYRLSSLEWRFPCTRGPWGQVGSRGRLYVRQPCSVGQPASSVTNPSPETQRRGTVDTN